MKKESSPSSPDLGIRIMKKNLGLRIMKKDNENLGLRIMKKLSNMDSSTNDGIGIRIMKKNNKVSEHDNGPRGRRRGPPTMISDKFVINVILCFSHHQHPRSARRMFSIGSE